VKVPGERRHSSNATTQLVSASESARAGDSGAAAESWFELHGRSFPWRDWGDPYRLVVVEVLLQRTRAETVAAFVEPFFGLYPGWPELARAERPILEGLLQPLGLHRRRADVLLRLAVTMTEDPVLGEHLPGFGQYVDRAVRVALRGEPVAMVDSNFVRVLKRMFGGPWRSDYRFDKRLQVLAQAFVAGASDPRAVNWAVLDLGATVCTPRRTYCQMCPLASFCEFAASRGRLNP
jgi:A/G-specific adenine glycosylase